MGEFKHTDYVRKHLIEDFDGIDLNIGDNYGWAIKLPNRFYIPSLWIKIKCWFKK